MLDTDEILPVEPDGDVELGKMQAFALPPHPFNIAAFAVPAQAVTLDNGVVLITQADALMGNVTPGDSNQPPPPP